ncbi:hypothetical protein ES150_00585 [Enterobacillus tribolii]|nr:hypothetical protein [Enterobacillus tribolii]
MLQKSNQLELRRGCGRLVRHLEPISANSAGRLCDRPKPAEIGPWCHTRDSQRWRSIRFEADALKSRTPKDPAGS